MWTTTEDAQRYQGLTDALQTLLALTPGPLAERRVSPEHLALYLEWMGLAREAAPSVRPFLDKSSPYSLFTLSYRQMGSDFRWLGGQISAIGDDWGPGL
jgi:hypothetical protein